MTSWPALLESIARDVARLVKPLLGTPGAREAVGQGAGGDETLAVDRDAEELIVETIRDSGNSCLLVSEEIGTTYLNDPGETTTTRVIVDPIDGSFNAGRGIPFVSTSLAYATGSTYADVQAGVILNLASGDLYQAERGRGAFLNGHPIQCSLVARLTEACGILTVSMTDDVPGYFTTYRPLLNPLKKTRMLGSSALEICLVAQGAAEFYLSDRQFVRSVDIAAAALILDEAGGCLMTRAGTPFTGQLTLKERGTLVASNAALQPEIRRILEATAPRAPQSY